MSASCKTGIDSRRHIRHGRQDPRNLLYMAAVFAIRCKPACKAKPGTCMPSTGGEVVLDAWGV